MGIWLPQTLWDLDLVKFCIGAGAYFCSVVICSTVEKTLAQYSELSKTRLLIYFFAVIIALICCFFINWELKQNRPIFSLIISSLGIILVFIFWWYQNKNNNAFEEPDNALGGKL